MSRTLAFLFLAVVVAGYSSCHQPKMKADLLVFNGVIHTLDDSLEACEAMAVSDGIIILRGSEKELRRQVQAAEVIDLKGMHVYPGLIDAHCHFLGYAQSLNWVDLNNANSLDQMLGMVEKHAAGTNSAWVLGRGWDQNKWEGNLLPTRDKLDILFPDRPVMLVRTDGHAIAVNSVVLELTGLADVKDTRGGEILIENGKPNGILLENTADRVKEMIPVQSTSEVVEALMRAQADCFAVGLTSVHDAGLGLADILLIDSLQRSGSLQMNVNAMLSPTRENFEYFVKKGTYVTDKLSVRSIKLYADGALGSRGALLLQDYTDSYGNRGISVLSADSIKRLASTAFETGYQVNTHAIGDSAVRLVLDIYAEILSGSNDLRWRIEHCQVVDPSDLPKFKMYSVIPSVNAVHATSDMGWAGQRLGPERVRNAYTYRDLLLQNGWLCNGSDFPVESINPMEGFIAASERINIMGNPPEMFQPENRISREEALKAMTIWAARAGFEENLRGSLRVGKKADFVIFDTDLLNARTADLPKAKVIATYINGMKVYSTL